MSDAVKVALIVALAPMLTVLLAWWQQRGKLKEIHVLVNSRLNEALNQIIDLKTRLGLPLTMAETQQQKDTKEAP